MFAVVQDAIAFIDNSVGDAGSLPFVRHEIQIRYNNGSFIDATFVDKESALAFLQGYQPPMIRPL